MRVPASTGIKRYSIPSAPCTEKMHINLEKRKLTACISIIEKVIILFYRHMCIQLIQDESYVGVLIHLLGAD